MKKVLFDDRFTTPDTVEVSPSCAKDVYRSNYIEGKKLNRYDLNYYGWNLDDSLVS